LDLIIHMEIVVWLRFILMIIINHSILVIMENGLYILYEDLLRKIGIRISPESDVWW